MLLETSPDFVKSKIPSGTPTYLMATGETVQRDGQEIKTIDRLQIGKQQIKFDIIAVWLSEMARCAQLHCWGLAQGAIGRQAFPLARRCYIRSRHPRARRPGGRGQ